MRDLEYAEKYPNLFVSIIQGKYWGVYVCRNGRDREAITYYEPTEQQLEMWNEEAGKALQEGWFFCSKCLKAHPISEYSTFNMAAKYCKTCTDADPEIIRHANSMTYD